MTVPTYDQFIEPLLRYLAAHPQGAKAGAVQDALAEALKLSMDDRAELLPSRAQAVFRNRIGWAHDRLKRADLSTSPQRGFWRLTPEGLQYATKHPKLTEEEIEKLTTVDPNVKLKAKPSGASIETSSTPIAPAPADKSSPEERIDAALTELRESVGRDLLESIAHSPPEFFEQLVLDLLHAMGYGAESSDLQRVGGSGDGGIDGIISLDRLGLEKIYVQAKRWKNSVGSPEIQGFMGALQLQSASKGIFITTSAYTKDARDAAKRARGTLVLIDGDQLTSLMIDNGVGVSHRAIRVPKVDGDYFEDV